MIKMKKTVTIITGILLVLTMFSVINAFEYNEDDEGNPIYEADAQIKAPSIKLKDLFILQPSSEPTSPELGMIYFDANSKRLKLYDGTGWYAIALEKVSTISKKQVEKIVKEESEVQTCSESTTCGEWGDCINNYQSMTCVTVDENCDKHEDTETRDCITENPFEEEIIEAGGNVGAVEEAEPITEEAEEEGVGEAEEEAEEEPPEVAIPDELFDITFDLEQTSLSKSDKLVVWITLQNFGKRYVPARLIYIVTDETDTEVYKKFGEIRVYTDESIIKRFDDMTLEEGTYTINMEVEYAGIVEEFSDDFSVETGIISAIKRFFKNWF